MYGVLQVLLEDDRVDLDIECEGGLELSDILGTGLPYSMKETKIALALKLFKAARNREKKLRNK